MIKSSIYTLSPVQDIGQRPQTFTALIKIESNKVNAGNWDRGLKCSGHVALSYGLKAHGSHRAQKTFTKR